MLILYYVFLNTKESGWTVSDLKVPPLLGRLLQSALFFSNKAPGKNKFLCRVTGNIIKLCFNSLESLKL